MSEYMRKLLDHRWVDRRREILENDNYRCRLCGSKHHVQVHHLAYITGAEPWQYPDEMLATLCDFCHYEEERYKKLIGFLIPELTSEGISCKDIYEYLNKLKEKDGSAQ